MLSHHTHSMFEFLAPPRRGKQPQQQQPTQPQPPQAAHSSQQSQSSQSSQSQPGGSRRPGHRSSASASVASMSSCPERIFWVVFQYSICSFCTGVASMLHGVVAVGLWVFLFCRGPLPCSIIQIGLCALCLSSCVWRCWFSGYRMECLSWCSKMLRVSFPNTALRKDCLSWSCEIWVIECLCQCSEVLGVFWHCADKKKDW